MNTDTVAGSVGRKIIAFLGITDFVMVFHVVHNLMSCIFCSLLQLKYHFGLHYFMLLINFSFSYQQFGQNYYM